MVIQKVEIQNFRLFYRDNAFNFTGGLNLIIGSCGDGKSTFFDALEWLFRTDGTNKMDINFISKKRCSELMPNDSDNVRVAITYEHKEKQKVLVKHFRFTKSLDGEISTSNYMFSLIENSGTECIVNDGVYFDKDLPSEIRTFMMYREGGNYAVFKFSNSIKLLVDGFAGVKNFDAYTSFMEYAVRNADRVRDYALRMDKKNTDRIKQLKHTIEQESRLIDDIEHEIKIKQDEVVSFEELLRNIELGGEPSKLVVAVNRRIEYFSQKRAEVSAHLREYYTQNLLEDMWVLVGFDNIAKEFSTKVNDLYSNSKNIERVHHFIEELQRRDAILCHNLPEISSIRNKIDEAITFNNRLHDDIKKIDANLNNEFEQKKRILAQADWLSEEQLLANYENISDWMDKKNRAESRIDVLKRQRELRRSTLEEAQLALNKMSEGTDAAKYAKIALFIRQIADAFKNAKEKRKQQIFYQLEDKANMFLQNLYGDDFTGIVRIIEKIDGQARIILVDDEGHRLLYPGYSLMKTYHLSVLLAIGEIASEDYYMGIPFILDGSFSCYDNTYGNKFFNATQRQMIILTSDYLRPNDDGGKVIDIDKLNPIDCTVYRIEKKKSSLHNTKLSSLQTVISKIK